MPDPSLTPLSDTFDAPVGRRDALRKLAVGGAVVWSAPLIARTASAASATSCVNRVVNFNTFTTGATFSSLNVGGTTMTLSPSVFSGGTAALGTNRTIVASPQGGVATKALRFEQTPVNNGGQLITLSFSQTVYSVTFTITDIDNLDGSWSDRIVINAPTTFTVTKPAGSTVIGAGTASGASTTTGPLRNSNADNNFPNTSAGGNAILSFPGPLTSLSFRFSCANEDGGQNQLINVTNMSFCS